MIFLLVPFFTQNILIQKKNKEMKSTVDNKILKETKRIQKTKIKIILLKI